MVAEQIVARGMRDERVARAMRAVPRELFVAEALREFAYADTALLIEKEQTISQPYVVAKMTEALELEGGERVLEIGTGSGYAAAVLAEIAAEVVTIERHRELADTARARLAAAGYENVLVLHGDGTKGYPPRAPYDAIVVAAGGPGVPRSLIDQLAAGGRLVIPVGETQRLQHLVRVRKHRNGHIETEHLEPVRFVPLVGEEGWREGTPTPRPRALTLSDRLAAACEPFDDLEAAGLTALMRRIGDAKLALLGEATHGTSEFYSMRARITRALIEEKGFDLVAVEADWPDAARIDAYVTHDGGTGGDDWTAFSRFPTWMWRNVEVLDFVEWLRGFNADLEDARRVAFIGLDLYSLYRSADRVIEYLETVDPELATLARERYGCLTPFQRDPVAYGRAAVTARYRGCEDEVVSLLAELLRERLSLLDKDGGRYLDAVENARVVRDAERYYRAMFVSPASSWNLRDSHMLETLESVMRARGSGSKAVVWAHNSHLGDARATEMSAHGEHNLGQLARQARGDAAYLVGFGTHGGTVAAASHWGGEMEIKEVRDSAAGSYERLCHDSRVPSFLLPLRQPIDAQVRAELRVPRLERAIGVIYHPETELRSHYFEADLPRQFDEWIWFDMTTEVVPLETAELEGRPDTFPFGL
jgi:protein-L-isoaspartate(D-aspartate) O-methyltransferase